MGLSKLSADGLYSIRLVFAPKQRFLRLQLLMERKGLSLNLLTLLFLTHLCFPRARTHTRKFFDLSYYNPETEKYRLGSNDAWLVSCYVVFFTGLRAAVMDYILAPLAQMGGIKKAKDQTRFSEQAWLLIYYSVFWPIGMVRSASGRYEATS